MVSVYGNCRNEKKCPDDMGFPEDDSVISMRAEHIVATTRAVLSIKFFRLAPTSKLEDMVATGTASNMIAKSKIYSRNPFFSNFNSMK